MVKHLPAVGVKKRHKLSDSDLSSGPLAMTMFLARRKKVPSELEDKTRTHKTENQRKILKDNIQHNKSV